MSSPASYATKRPVAEIDGLLPWATSEVIGEATAEAASSAHPTTTKTTAASCRSPRCAATSTISRTSQSRPVGARLGGHALHPDRRAYRFVVTVATRA